tara:strand:- start:895 stop:1770 length:876 start_codon:yes stop_codon:yes gene_type:complete
MKIKILIPIFNDWNSVKLLIKNIDIAIKDINADFSVIIVNDASTQEKPDNILSFRNLKSIKIINMISNRGHGRCNAAGLKYIYEKEDFDYVLPMDGDGEDRPDEIVQFVEKITKNPNISVVGKRVKRSENNIFKFCYEVHKIITYIFTGKLIRFGHFTCIPKSVVKKMINEKATWNCYSASLVKITKIRDSIPSIRGKRYFDLSKMSFYNLITHSLSIISVFKTNVIIRSLGFIILYSLIIQNNFSIITSFPIVLIIIFNILILKLSQRENMQEYDKCLENISDIDVVKND